MLFSSSIIAAAAVLFSTANAHMFINQPVPIPGTNPKDPLIADGSNFPCHGSQYITGKGGINMAVGSQQPLTFELGATANTAVHGGGSCQVSLTYETDPQKVKDPSNWKVIYSIIGGCPTNSPLNLDGQFKNATDPSKTYTGAYACSDPASNGFDCVNAFSFTVPKEVRNGKATLGFTWFNAVGNREMYMNCADVTLTGGSDQIDKLPTMQVANIAAGGLASGTDCATEQFTYPLFPDPGQYVFSKTVSGAAKAFQTKAPYPYTGFQGTGCQKAVAAPAGSQQAAPTSAAASPAQATSGSSSQNGGYIGNSAAPAASTPSAAGNPGGVFAPGAASATTLATAQTPAQATAAPAAAAPSAAAPAAAAPQGSSSGNTSSGSCTNGATSCPTNGAIVCLPNNQWGLCNWGCATPMQMAAGMMCQDGTMKAAISRRDARHPHGLAHRRSLL